MALLSDMLPNACGIVPGHPSKDWLVGPRPRQPHTHVSPIPARPTRVSCPVGYVCGMIYLTAMVVPFNEWLTNTSRWPREFTRMKSHGGLLQDDMHLA